jgi:hypothetical protein
MGTPALPPGLLSMAVEAGRLPLMPGPRTRYWGLTPREESTMAGDIGDTCPYRLDAILSYGRAAGRLLP